MIFRHELAEKILAGEKTVTRRVCSDNPRSPWCSLSCGLRPGETYAVCPGRGKPAVGRVRVLHVRKERLGDITFGEACREGFSFVSEFRRAWREIHGCWDPFLWVWRVEFELVKEQVSAPLPTEGNA